MGGAAVSVTAWAARWGTTVHVWPAQEGALFDALPPDGTPIPHPEGITRLRRDDPESVFDWVCRATEAGNPDEVLAWIVRGDPDSVWDGKTVG